MLSYELVKTLHIVSAFVLVGFATVSLLSKNSRGVIIAYGIGSLATVIAGLGLIGILKMGMPVWMHIKFSIWLLIMAGIGIVNKRFPAYKIHAAVALYALAGFAVYLAVYKPW